MLGNFGVSVVKVIFCEICINGTFLATNSITYHATNSYHNNTNLTNQTSSGGNHLDVNDRFCDCVKEIKSSRLNLGCFETLKIYLKEKYHGLIIGIFSGVVIFELFLIGFAGTIETHRYILN